MAAKTENANSWVYRGEGNRCLAVGNSFSNEVYLLTKLRDKVSSHEVCADVKRSVQNEVDFGRCVLRPLIGEKYVPVGKVVCVSKDFLSQIEEKMRKHRSSRRLLEKLDPAGFAVCLPDACSLPKVVGSYGHGPVVCVEVKPKTGFLPRSSTIPVAHHKIRQSVCRYCMQQCLKLHQGKIQERSQYCPLDLFSGTACRMDLAIKALVRNPQNNFKVFRDGHVIYSGDTENHQQPLQDCLTALFTGNDKDSKYALPGDLGTQKIDGLVDRFSELLRQMLVHPLDESESCYGNTTPSTTPECCTESRAKLQQGDSQLGLVPGSVLYNILHAQQLDVLDIEGIYPLYQRLVAHLDAHPEDWDTWCLKGPYDNTQWTVNHNVVKKCIENIDSIESVVALVKAFLVSLTAKDGSVMVAMQRVENGADVTLPVVTDTVGNKYMFNIQVVDTKPKPLHRIQKYFSLNKDIVQAYIQTVGYSSDGTIVKQEASEESVK
ncbi:PREDICTED: inositol-pentakisphosphate 2-kinase-like [Branchiostoma belcheri]|uniref:Inositol-pentakisphosphate 2-kinase n=1 Tax=Branchiostoma belcheri TaxID=7741 RepID=A0A6P4YP85_BRABE|nr:PREDICTED: inositol-pentakisphosphate 2-kinase-like [Branchiostoma belcheri]